MKERLDGVPQRVGRVAIGGDDLQNLTRHGGVDPGENDKIILHPIGIAPLGGAVDVVGEAELAEDRVEKASPLTIVSLLKVKNHWYVGFDVNQLDLRGRSRLSSDLGAERR